MLPRNSNSSQAIASFTLVEVVVALAIFVFAILGVAGLLLTSIQNEHTSIEQSWAVETLREATAAVNATTNYTLGTVANANQGTYWFTNAFPGGTNNANLNWTYVSASGNSTPATNTFVVPSPNPSGQVLCVITYPPNWTGQPLGVYLSVAWPSAATYGNNGWTNAQGFQETYFNVMPPY